MFKRFFFTKFTKLDMKEWHSGSPCKGCLPRHSFHRASVSITLRGISLILLNSENTRAWSSNEPSGHQLTFLFFFLKGWRRIWSSFSLLTLHKQCQYCNFYSFPRLSKVRSFPLGTVSKKNATLMVLFSTKHISKESPYAKIPSQPQIWRFNLELLTLK